ncbi:uncharacterized protein EI90DRAFT_2080641 [Cantharellus anzutake]|uniref:uncharacterized protein n=1 Tax=Cantharellus anzutake TaxID=1750568 RepID=UPI0019041B50|nr:uncharacterized protein EI90DRAFT_2080641 [Cantharellus anzutake]KAF8340531.1 hypothetical protein EI90DRAFT_2080641 [Cantharellus anzutake]
MCFQVKCSTCQKITWKGCGKHVDQAPLRIHDGPLPPIHMRLQVMKNVDEKDKCTCTRETSSAVSTTTSTSPPQSWGSRFAPSWWKS